MIRIKVVLAAGVLASAFALPAQASLIGDTVSCSVAVLPDPCSTATAVVGDGQEFNGGFFHIDLHAESVTLIGPHSGAGTVRPGPGASITISDIHWVDAPLATLAGIANFSAASVLNAEASDIFVGPHSFKVDLNGWELFPSATIRFDLIKQMTVVPLPPSALLMLGGLGLCGLFGWCRSG